MLNLYRRHTPVCATNRGIKKGDPKYVYDAEYRRCRCPIYLKGSVGAEKVHSSLKTRNWQEAATRLQEVEGRGYWDEAFAPSKPESAKTVAGAVDDFMRDAQHGRRLAPKTVEKYELLLRHLKEFGNSKGVPLLRQFTTEYMREFRESWRKTRLADTKMEQPIPLGPRTAAKRLELLKAFFRFALDSGWIADNPVRSLKPPKLVPVQKLPFTEPEMERIYEACGKMKMDWGYQEGVDGIKNDELRTFILLLRYSGIRIGDAAMLTPDRITLTGDLFLYMQKTGEPVSVPLPEFLLKRLRNMRLRHGLYYFVGPRSRDVDVVAEIWRRKIARVCALAGLPGATPHRFRHTFAVNLLLKGTSLEDVAVLLGHSSVKITEKHYAAWVRSRQQALEEQVKKTWIEPKGLS